MDGPGAPAPVELGTLASAEAVPSSSVSSAAEIAQSIGAVCPGMRAESSSSSSDKITYVTSL
jgi:hypothetical protein